MNSSNWYKIVAGIAGVIGFFLAISAVWDILGFNFAAFGNLLLGAILMFGAYKLYTYIENKKLAQAKAFIDYINSIAPNEYTNWMRVHIPEQDAQNFIGEYDRGIKFMFLDNQKRITFPESKYGNDRGYYLTEVDFAPKYNSRISGNTKSTTSTFSRFSMKGNQQFSGSGNHNNYGNYGNSYFNGTGKMNASGSGSSIGFTSGKFDGNSEQYEVPARAMLTFVEDSTHNDFKIRFLDLYQENVDYLEQYYVLSNSDKKYYNID